MQEHCRNISLGSEDRYVLVSWLLSKDAPGCCGSGTLGEQRAGDIALHRTAAALQMSSPFQHLSGGQLRIDEMLNIKCS